MHISKLASSTLWLSLGLGSIAGLALAQDEQVETVPAAGETSAPAPDSSSLPTPAAPLNQPAAAEDLISPARPWIPSTYGVSLLHYYGFRGEVDPFTVATLGVSWKGETYSYAVSQRLTKYYFISSGNAEVQPADTYLSVSRQLKEQVYGFTGSTTFALTLPVSEFSREQSVVTKPRFEINFFRPFFDEKLNYSLGAALQYNWNQYSSTRTDLGAGGGRPLRQYSYELENTLSYMLSEKLSADAALTYIRVAYHDIGFRNRQTTATGDALLNTDYSIGLGLSYQVLDQLSVSGGYSQSDVVEKTGGVNEAYLFDSYTTQWYIGMATSF